MSKMLNSYIGNYLKTYTDYKDYWNYEDGCILIGTELLYKSTGKKEYYDFIKNYLDNRLDGDGKIETLNISEFNIDAINSGRALFNIYKETKDIKYKNAIEEVMYQLAVQPRTAEGNFWHKGRYPYQVWLDGLYMAQPFYAMYAKAFGGKKELSDVLNQFKNVKKYLCDEETGLYYHGYDETRRMNWADRKTGASPNFWGRSIGWYTMALVDVIEVLEDVDGEKKELINIFRECIESIAKYQDDEGMWHQVITQEGRERNYAETSATLMFSYAILKGTRLGYLGEEFEEKGLKAFDGIMNKYFSEKNKKMSLGGICIMAGLNGIIPFNGDRNGSYEYYVSEKIGSDDPKGVGPLFMAYSEILKR